MMSRGPQVLVVDPDRESAVEVQKLLQLAGISVAGAAGYGVEAYVQAHQAQPDVVLMRVEEPPCRSWSSRPKGTSGSSGSQW